jgi:hypothetical protein
MGNHEGEQTMTTQAAPRFQDKDFSETGLRLEGSYENDRNRASSELFKAIIREAYGVTDVIVAHHLTYVAEDKRADGFTYETVQEIPSADALIFDHEVAKKLWGESWKERLYAFAMEPIATRDEVVAKHYYSRPAK